MTGNEGRISLPGSGRLTSRLGFGTSALIGGRTASEARYLLDAAWDAGISHFDTARLYGTGDCEALVGNWARSAHRDVTVATKFGIDPLTATAGTQIVKRAVRLATRRSPYLRELARRKSGAAVKSGRFTVADLSRSLAQSETHLGFPPAVLFLHDCTADEWRTPELREALDALAADGRIGCYGVATDYVAVGQILDAGLPIPPVTQLPRCIDRPGLNLHGFKIFFSPLVRLGAIRAALAADAARAARWSQVLNLDVSNGESVGDLLLCEALDANQNGIVLFSSGSASRIERNASLLRDPPFDRSQLEAVRRLATEL